MTGARTPRALFRGRNVECDTSGDRRQATSDRRQHTLALYLARSLTRSFKSRKLPLPVDQSQTAMEKKKLATGTRGTWSCWPGGWLWVVESAGDERAFAAVELWIETGVRGVEEKGSEDVSWFRD